LHRGGHLPLQKGLDLLLALRQVFPAAHLVEMHVALNPVTRLQLSTINYFEAQDAADLI
jgi:hypothetical protein